MIFQQKDQGKSNRGISILGILVLGAALILVLSYFDIRLRSVVESESSQENFGYVKGEATSVWDKYLKGPANYLWHDVWINIFWRAFIENMERLRDGKSTEIEQNVPSVSY